MTTLFDKEVECSVCGEKSTHMVIGSTNSFGSPDLDTRQPEMQRSTIYHWIQRCPKCGYCSSNLSKCSENTKEIVNSKTYQNISGSVEMSVTAASFLARSYELEQQQAYSDSAWKAIHAAWICDDNNNIESSIKCRKQAIALIEKANNHGQIFIDQVGANEAIIIDLMRRSGMHQQALELSKSIKKEDIEEIILQIIQYQEVLIAKNDTAAHIMSEVIGE
ncbi:MAG: DUF2225 domain-containing protein [Candidatus Methylopumilus sp.]|nr:DUF2225 domain-containing protein [Candidatus Methylopumilus sp.]